MRPFHYMRALDPASAVRADATPLAGNVRRTRVAALLRAAALEL